MLFQHLFEPLKQLNDVELITTTYFPKDSTIYLFV